MKSLSLNYEIFDRFTASNCAVPERSDTTHLAIHIHLFFKFLANAAFHTIFDHSTLENMAELKTNRMKFWSSKTS